LVYLYFILDTRNIFKVAKPYSRPIVHKFATPLAPPVKPRELYVASVDEKIDVIPAIMAIYSNIALYPFLSFPFLSFPFLSFPFTMGKYLSHGIW
jgi:hypothetical protein